MITQIVSGDTAATANTVGGELLSFSKGGVDYLWNGNPQYWSGHSPVLFPTVGALKDLKTEIGGKIYPIQKHGFARRAEFSVAAKTSDSVRYSLKPTDEMLANYPFEFELSIAHMVFDGGFKTEFRVTNRGADEMLFGIGGHPGFNCPLFPNTQFTDYSVLFEKPENGPVYYSRAEDCGGIIHREDRVPAFEGKSEVRLDYSLFDRDAMIFDNLCSRTVKLVEKSSGRGVELLLEGFNALGLWSPPLKEAPFLCLEPWSVTPDFSDHSGRFAEKPHITRLVAGAEFFASYTAKII